MDKQYVINPEPLGLQRNALRVEVIPPMPRCALRPKSDIAVIFRNRFQWRTDQLARIWSDFDYCVSDACKQCPVFKQHRDRISPFTSGIVRLDISRGDYWMMNHKDKGWSSYGYPFKSLVDIVNKWAVDIDATRKSDEHGLYYEFLLDT